MDEDHVITALAALAHKTRLRILRYLVERGDEGAPAGDVGTAVDASSSRASFHLSALSAAGLITATRVSRSIIYRVDFNAMGAMTGYLVHDCCKNHRAVTRCC